jgi:hypothetical protein
MFRFPYKATFRVKLKRRFDIRLAMSLKTRSRLNWNMRYKNVKCTVNEI